MEVVNVANGAGREQRSGRIWRPNIVGLSYLAVIVVLSIGWMLRNQNLTRADDGLGYAMGIVGGVLMLLLLIYPLRKRIRGLQSLGSVKAWFQTHMIFGVLGPVLVVLHSNFNLGSFNSRIALGCTLIVAGSGIIGRYLYAKIHDGMYGHRITLSELRVGHEQTVSGNSPLSGVFELINQRLDAAEARVIAASAGMFSSFGLALGASVSTRTLKRKLLRELEQTLGTICQSSPTLEQHRGRLRASTVNYLDRRLATLRKYSQLSAFERLFGLWHVVHFPLFIVMVLAAIVHVIAVHAY